VGTVLRDAPCNVAVFVDQERSPVIGEKHPVYVASGSGENDRLAMEVAARIAEGAGAPLRTAEDLSAAPKSGGLLVVGLPDNWRRRGLGRARGGLAQAGEVPTLFVRAAAPAE
jgi:hypothetical protein